MWNARRTSAFVGLAFALMAAPGQAALKPGATAPDFTLPAFHNGQPHSFALAQALKKGPVVVYFFPAAFTPSCSIEARNFAEAMPKFTAVGASVLGISSDPAQALGAFSARDCQGAFPVASDPAQTVIRGYDAADSQTRLAARTSYLIGKDGRIVAAFHDENPDYHVEEMLDALAKTR